MFKTSLFTLLPLLLAASTQAATRAPVENGMPCVARVCVGDDARSLAGIPWVAPVNPANNVPLSRSRVSEADLAELDDVLDGPAHAVRTLAPYWYLRRLDAVALAALADIRAVCANIGASDRLTGTYRNGRGLLTDVSLEPVESGTGLRFVVAAIVQHLAADSSADDLAAAGADFRARYAGVPAYASREAPGAVWVTHSAQGAYLKLLAPIGDAARRAREYRDAAACETHDAIAADASASAPGP